MSVLIVHHLKKAQQESNTVLRNDPRAWIEKTYGPQSLIGHVDNIWGLEADAEGYTFATVTRSQEPLTLRLEKKPDSEKFLLSEDTLASLTPVCPGGLIVSQDTRTRPGAN